MKESAVITPDAGEKHTLENMYFGLIDRQGKIIWSSNDFDGRQGTLHSMIPETVSENQRELVMSLLGRCIIQNQIVGYVAHLSTSQPEFRGSQWRTTFMPVGIGEVVAFYLTTMVPSRYDEITDEEKIILRLLASDKTLKEVAQELHRSESAIDTKIKTLKLKLGSKNIGGLVATAITQFVI